MTKISLEDVHAEVANEQYHVFPGSQLTVCCLTLQNGFTVTGESACADPAEFDETVGRKIAMDKALDKIWMLLGYTLKEQMYRGETKNGAE